MKEKLVMAGMLAAFLATGCSDQGSIEVVEGDLRLGKSVATVLQQMEICYGAFCQRSDSIFATDHKAFKGYGEEEYEESEQVEVDYEVPDCEELLESYEAMADFEDELFDKGGYMFYLEPPSGMSEGLRLESGTYDVGEDGDALLTLHVNRGNEMEAMVDAFDMESCEETGDPWPEEFEYIVLDEYYLATEGELELVVDGETMTLTGRDITLEDAYSDLEAVVNVDLKGSIIESQCEYDDLYVVVCETVD